jgi:hypothetical protein
MIATEVFLPGAPQSPPHRGYRADQDREEPLLESGGTSVTSLGVTTICQPVVVMISCGLFVVVEFSRELKLTPSEESGIRLKL